MTIKYFDRFIVISFLFLLVPSCKTKLDILAPGKESVVVYGILNINERVQNIRINKTYITDGDALEVAQDNNQINFGPGELVVTLERFVNGSNTPTLTTVGNYAKKSIVLTETVITTQSGTFNSNQRLWQTTDKLFGTGSYKLTITNTTTGAVVTSQTNMVDSVKPFGPQQQMPFLYLPGNPSAYPVHGTYPITPAVIDKPKYINHVIMTDIYAIKFRTVPNARLYDVVMRLHYTDSMLNGTGQHNYVDYNFFETRSLDINGGALMDYFKFPVSGFYENLGFKMSKRDSPYVKKRIISHMEYIITAGSEELADFLQINALPNTIAQDKPNYTNINGGVGIFSSRSTSILTKDLWGDFIDKIACNPNTNPYRFCNSAGFITYTICN